MADELRFERRMSDSDALLWRVERDPLVRSTITSVAIFDGPFDRQRLEHGVERASRLVPRLRQRVLSSPVSPSPRWVVDPVDLERDPAELPPMPEPPVPERPGLVERFLDSVEHERRRQLGIARRSLENVGRLIARPKATAAQGLANLGSAGRLLAPAFSPLSPLMTERSLSVRFDTLSLPTDELKAAARKAEGKLNDAFVAAVLGGLRRYHDRHGTACDALRMTMPINVRDDDQAGVAGNAFVPARFQVPLDVDDPIERMRAVRELVQQQRREPSLGFSEAIAGVLNRLPVAVVTDVFGRMLKGIDLVTSNVPGVPVPVYIAGARLDAQFAFGPLAGSAMNLTLLSYVDECQIGVNVDPAAVPDVDVLLTCLRESFDEVRKVG